MELLEILGIIGAITGFTEWRLRVFHKCTERIESKLDKHLENADELKERFYKVEEKTKDM